MIFEVSNHCLTTDLNPLNANDLRAASSKPTQRLHQNRKSARQAAHCRCGGQYMAIRNSTNVPASTQTVVDHVCYTIANWDEARVRGALKAKGIEPAGREGSINFLDPFNYYVQIASAAGENAFRR